MLSLIDNSILPYTRFDDMFSRRSPGLTDTGTAYRANFEVPGYTEKDLHVTVTEDYLKVWGERKANESGLSAASFERILLLPDKGDPERVQARLENGILHVSVEKSPRNRPRDVPIRVLTSGSG